MKKNRIFLSLFLLLTVLATNLGSSKGRKLLETVQESSTGSSTWEQQKVEKEGDEEIQDSLNNHHTIPRESYGGWDNSPPAPAEGDQLQPQKGRTSDNHT
ncbi:hypothetical protein NE237_010411 [Protea cynaroides]|uniref:Uncharacterized protein n=1 Tax=Protea cynaroides TaxID=273540 RepID=A0A9Q0KZQ0_9MAGN|nr:hypothetical protein NE237_010411 [Protea cynaroides]